MPIKEICWRIKIKLLCWLGFG